MMLTAGCSDVVRTVGVEPTISVDQQDNGYRTTIDVSHADNYTYTDLRVTGIGPDGESVCTVPFGQVEPGSRQRTETVICDRLPLMFVPQSLNGSQGQSTPGSDVVVSHRRVVLTRATNATLRYEQPPEILSEGPVAYAKCAQRRNESDPAVFQEPAPWLSWEQAAPQVERGYGISAGNRTGYAVFNDANGVELESIPVPPGNGTAPLRALLDRAAAEEADPGQVIDTERSLSREQLVALFDTLHDEDIESFKEVPVPDRGDNRSPVTNRTEPYAAGAYYDTRHIDCTNRAVGDYRGGKGVSVTYALEYDGDTFIVRAGGGTRWSGPAFNTTS